MLSPCGNAYCITVQIDDGEEVYIVTIVKQA